MASLKHRKSTNGAVLLALLSLFAVLLAWVGGIFGQLRRYHEDWARIDAHWVQREALAAQEERFFEQWEGWEGIGASVKDTQGMLRFYDHSGKSLGTGVLPGGGKQGEWLLPTGEVLIAPAGADGWMREYIPESFPWEDRFSDFGEMAVPPALGKLLEERVIPEDLAGIPDSWEGALQGAALSNELSYLPSGSSEVAKVAVSFSGESRLFFQPVLTEVALYAGLYASAVDRRKRVFARFHCETEWWNPYPFAIHFPDAGYRGEEVAMILRWQNLPEIRVRNLSNGDSTDWMDLCDTPEEYWEHRKTLSFWQCFSGMVIQPGEVYRMIQPGPSQVQGISRCLVSGFTVGPEDILCLEGRSRGGSKLEILPYVENHGTTADHVAALAREPALIWDALPFRDFEMTIQPARQEGGRSFILDRSGDYQIDHHFLTFHAKWEPGANTLKTRDWRMPRIQGLGDGLETVSWNPLFANAREPMMWNPGDIFHENWMGVNQHEENRETMVGVSPSVSAIPGRWENLGVHDSGVERPWGNIFGEGKASALGVNINLLDADGWTSLLKTTRRKDGTFAAWPESSATRKNPWSVPLVWSDTDLEILGQNIASQVRTMHEQRGHPFLSVESFLNSGIIAKALEEMRPRERPCGPWWPDTESLLRPVFEDLSCYGRWYELVLIDRPSPESSEAMIRRCLLFYAGGLEESFGENHQPWKVISRWTGSFCSYVSPSP